MMLKYVMNNVSSICNKKFRMKMRLINKNYILGGLLKTANRLGTDERSARGENEKTPPRLEFDGTT